MLEELKREVYQALLELPKNNLVTGTSGNVSGREDDYVVIKPSGVKYEKLSPLDLVVVDMEGNLVEGDLKPSVDTGAHLHIYRLSNFLGIYDTYLAVILFHSSFQMGFCSFFLRNFIRTILTDLLDAARVDGSSEFRIFLQIVLPLTKPALAALGILEFTWSWNDYLWGVILLASDHLRPITVGLVSLQREYLSKWNVISAGSLIAAAVPLLVFLIFQRYFIQGLMMGAKK